MSEELKPDTTEAVAKAIADSEPSSYRTAAKAAIAAHNEELARQGYVTMRVFDPNVVHHALMDYKTGSKSMQEVVDVLGLPIEVQE